MSTVVSLLKRAGLDLMMLAVIVLGITVYPNGIQNTVNAMVQQPQEQVDTGNGSVANAGPATPVDLTKVPQAPANIVAKDQHAFRTGVSESEYAQRKAEAVNHGITPANGEQPMAAPVDLSSSGTSQLSPTADNNNAGMSYDGWSPSDMALAVGSAYVVQVVNEEIAVYNKAGVIQTGFPKTLQAFTGCSCTNSLFDPRAFYDWRQGRYVILIDRSNGSKASSSFYLIISQTNNPLGAWWIYQITYGGADDFGDYPTLGSDILGIYTCANTFSNSTGAFTGNKCFLVPKSVVYSGGSLAYWWQGPFTYGGTLVDTLQPAQEYANDAPRAEFMVNSLNIKWGGGQCRSGCAGLLVWSIANPFGWLSGGPGPAFSGMYLSTATYILAPGANAPSCSNCVESMDTRISGMVQYHAGSIWAALVTGVGSPASPGIRWYEIRPILNDNGGGTCTGAYLYACPTLASVSLQQQGLFWYGSGNAAYFPALVEDAENNVTMVLAYSTPAVYPSVVYTSRRIDFAQNSFHDGGLYLAVGAGAVTGHIRWGDYFATSVDESTWPNRLWFAGQRLNGTNIWSTRIGDNQFLVRTSP